MRSASAAMMLLLSLLCVACRLSSATLQLPAVIDSHMVLQRNSPATIWGWTDQPAGTVIDVTVTSSSGASVASSTNSRADGSWSLPLGNAAQTDFTQVFSVSISDQADKKILEDIVFGDVILCSGQSNMELTVFGAFNNASEIADSANYPLLRMFTTAKVTSLTPLSDLTSKVPQYNWSVSGPDAFQENGDGAWSVFSATCYFTGRDVYKSLGGKIPIGMVASMWGGTHIEAWSTAEALAKCPTGGEETVAIDEAWAADDAARGDPDPGVNSVLWNGMIAPLLQMQFKLAVWYQGEANAGNPPLYSCRFPAMISDWRKQFNQPLPFFFVQLAAYAPGGMNWPAQQIAQTAALSLPNVGMASAIDLGDPTSPDGDIHPRNKQSVGMRLSNSILDIVYGSDVVSVGPVPDNMSVTSGTNQNVSVVFTFPDGIANSDLHFDGTEACSFNFSGGCCDENPFQLIDSTNVWHRALAVEIDGLQVTVTGPQLPTGVTVEVVTYSYQPYAQCCLYNAAGLPMTPIYSNFTQAARAKTTVHKHRIVLKEESM